MGIRQLFHPERRLEPREASGGPEKASGEARKNNRGEVPSVSWCLEPLWANTTRMQERFMACMPAMKARSNR